MHGCHGDVGDAEERGIAVACGTGEDGALRDGDGCVAEFLEGDVVEGYVVDVCCKHVRSKSTKMREEGNEGEKNIQPIPPPPPLGG